MHTISLLFYFTPNDTPCLFPLFRLFNSQTKPCFICTQSETMLKMSTRFDNVNEILFNPLFHPFPIVTNELLLDNYSFFTPPTSSLDVITDLFQLNAASPFRRVKLGSELTSLKTLERKYTWTAEIKSVDEERKYKWTTEIKNGKTKKSSQTAEVKSKRGPVERKYTFKASDSESEYEEKKKKDEKKVKGKGKKSNVRVVEIDDTSDHGAIVLRQVFAKRRGKQPELSQQDAAALIQLTYRTYLIRRSQVLRALRELAIGKNKLKEIRTLFNNFTYRRRLARDAEERQRFSEKIIVLLLTVEAIQGDDLMVRAAKNSMVDELEAMLDVVEPLQCGQPLYMRRRTFDMPDGVMNKELAEGVAQVVKMLDEEVADSETFEVCL